jgi:peroxidase
MANITNYGAFTSDLLDIINSQRGLDGTGNNVANPGWGIVGHTFLRGYNSYADGVGNDTQNIIDQNFPSAQLITDLVQNGDNVDVKNAFNMNEYGQFFGQFVTHDITGTVPGGDPAFGSLATRNLGVTVNGVRQQVDGESSFLDLGHVYDQSQPARDLLWDSDTGLMHTTNGVLPTRAAVAEAENDDSVLAPGPFGPVNPQGRITGDGRFFQTEQLASHHTAWVLNHNYHVEKLAEQNPGWSGEQLFKAAQALNEAEFQWVVYNEYLPMIIGDNVRDYSGYKPGVNPGIINEFTNIAFRFGHDQANNTFNLLEENGAVSAGGANFSLQNSFNGFDGTTKTDNAADQADWIRGQLGIATQKIDGFIANGNRGGLFGIPGLNLAAFDIDRGRDHGNQNYNDARESVGLDRYATWDEFFANSILDEDTDGGAARKQALKDLYGSNPGDVDNMEALIGVLLEEKLDRPGTARDSQMGETATRMIATQFENVRDGDRYYFENRFDADQIAEIKKVTLSDIIARTSDIDHVYRDALVAANRTSASNGSGQEDLMVGSNAANTFRGLGGGDDIYGEGGDDLLDGGVGRDWIWGGFGADTLVGGNNEDKLWGEAGNDTLRGGVGDDELHGGEGVDTIEGGTGDDFIFGDGGNDRIDGGAGNDTISGGEGNDIITYSGGDDVITDLHMNGGERVVFANLGGQQVITQAQWVAFLAGQNTSNDGGDLVIDFGATGSLTLQDHGLLA